MKSVKGHLREVKVLTAGSVTQIPSELRHLDSWDGLEFSIWCHEYELIDEEDET